jgi:hypothetical protein
MEHRAEPAWLKVPVLLVFAFFLQPLSMFGQVATLSPTPSTTPSPTPSTTPSPTPSTTPSPTPSTRPSPTPSTRAVRTFRTCDFLANQAARPDNPALRISRDVVDYVDERLRDHNKAVTAGMESSKEIQQVVPAPTPANEWFSHPSVFAEYDYIYSNNTQSNGADSHTNSATAGFSFFTKYDILLGLTYQYSNRDADLGSLNFPDSENSHFFSLYVAKSFCHWLNCGVSGGYGYISTSRLGTDTGSEDSWTLSPYLGVWHSWGAFSASLTTLYEYVWTEAFLQPRDASNETGRVVVTLRLGYALTERLAVEASAAYVGITNYKPAAQNLLAPNWATFGAKLTYALIGPLNVYAGFAYDAFNQSYKNYTAQAGLSYSW